MINRHDLVQLEKDASKAGAWQAKLAYATYCLRFDANRREQAKIYLEEITNLEDKKLMSREEIMKGDMREYINEAKRLHELLFPTNNWIVRTALDDVRQRKVAALESANQFVTQGHRSSPEAQYKIARYEYDAMGKTKDDMVTELKKLLSDNEMTDSLRAKIYFQLIRINIEQAEIKGQRSYLEEAKQYCLLLINDPTLKYMSKAGEAAKIYKTIRQTTDKPILDFPRYYVDSFDFGEKISTMFFKYAGVVLGNVFDFCLFCLPKVFPDGEVVMNSAKSNAQAAGIFFKELGFAAGFKFLGELFGKHIVGNFIAGPIAGLIGTVTYPFSYLYNKYKKNNNVITNAKKAMSLTKEKNNQSTHQLVDQSLGTKNIFSHRDGHTYGDNISLNEGLSAKPRIMIKPTCFSDKCSYAYGRIFGNAVVVNKKSAETVAVPEQKSLYPNIT